MKNNKVPVTVYDHTYPPSISQVIMVEQDSKEDILKSRVRTLKMQIELLREHMKFDDNYTRKAIPGVKCVLPSIYLDQRRLEEMEKRLLNYYTRYPELIPVE